MFNVGDGAVFSISASEITGDIFNKQSPWLPKLVSGSRSAGVTDASTDADGLDCILSLKQLSIEMGDFTLYEALSMDE